MPQLCADVSRRSLSTTDVDKTHFEFEQCLSVTPLS